MKKIFFLFILSLLLVHCAEEGPGITGTDYPMTTPVFFSSNYVAAPPRVELYNNAHGLVGALEHYEMVGQYHIRDTVFLSKTYKYYAVQLDGDNNILSRKDFTVSESLSVELRLWD